MNFENYGRRRRFGSFQQLQSVPQGNVLTFADFSGGLDLRDVRQDIAANSTPLAQDTECSPRGRIKRVHGVEGEEGFLTTTIEQLAVHASLDYTAELLLIAPPFLGIKKEGETQWVDVGLLGGPRYAWVNFGGTFLLSNTRDNKVWAREPGATELRLVEGAIGARTYASFAARIFAGSAILDGNDERMGVGWSAASSRWDDWDGRGSGFELLIDDMSAGDRVVALKTLGFDMMIVACRNSLWLGQRTGLVDRPAHFQPRVPKLGAVNSQVCASTRLGLVFLHDSGVWLFDGNEPVHLSAQIDSELLPLDFDQLEAYSAAYNPKTQKYYLMTPRETFVLNLSKMSSERKLSWHKMTLQAQSAMLWSQQFNAVTWDEAIGLWDEQELTWDEMNPQQGEDYRLWFLGAYGEGQALGYEEEGARCYFDQAQRPFWQVPLVQDQPIDRLLTSRKVVLEYRGGGRLGFRQTDVLGDYLGTAVYDLPTTEKDRVASLPYVHTGLGEGLQLDWASDSCVEVSKIELEVLPRGPRIQEVPLVRETGHADYDNLSTL